MQQRPACPKCGHEDIARFADGATIYCPQCKYHGAADLAAEQHHPAHALAADLRQSPGLNAIIEGWPTPIAHELDALCRLLESGDTAGAFYQLRDLAEVLIKLPTVILARDLTLNAPDAPVTLDGRTLSIADHVRHTLLGRSPATGTWLTLLETCARSAYHRQREQQSPTLLSAPIAGLIYQIDRDPLPPNPKQTALIKALHSLQAWRNSNVGHGGFRPDPLEQLAHLHACLFGTRPGGQAAGGGDLPKDIEPLVPALEAAQALQPWADRQLVVGTTPLTGAAALSPAPADHAKHESGETQALRLLGTDSAGAGAGAEIDLGPYLSARVCDYCGHRDLFFYNGYNGRSGLATRRFKLLEYRRAHGMERYPHQLPELLAALPPALTDDQAEPAPPPAEAAYQDQSLVALLDEVALERRFIPPSHLYERIADFIQHQTSGCLWLSAPAHIGKTMLVAGLDGQLGTAAADTGTGSGSGPAAALYRAEQRVAVASLYIRREYRYGIGALRDRLTDALRAALDISPEGDQQRGLPQLDTNNPDHPAALLEWLAAWRKLRFGTPLLVCIDGLDELPPGPDGILDYLPAPADLPPGLFLLLTSRPGDPDTRPEDQCPDWIWTPTRQRMTSGGPYLAIDLDTDHPDYRALLAHNYQRELADSWVSNARTAFERWLDRSAATADPANPADPATGIPEHGPNDAPHNGYLPDPSKVRDRHGQRLDRRLQDCWTEARAARGLDGPKQPPAAPFERLQQTFATLFERLFELADRRFLYLSYLIDQVAEGGLDADLAQLPRGADLHRHFLAQLAKQFGPKQLDLARRVLLLLAATEQAHGWYQNTDNIDQTPVDPRWLGLPFDQLIGLLGATEIAGTDADGSGTEITAPQLNYVLYRLKAVLGAWRAAAARHSHFRIGLKGLTQAIAASDDWRPDLQRTHQRLAGAALDMVEAIVPGPQAAGQIEQAGDGEHGDGQIEAQADPSPPRLTDPLDQHRLRYLLAHAHCADSKALEQRLVGQPRLPTLLNAQVGVIDEGFAQQAPGSRRESIAWLSLVIALAGRARAAGGEALITADEQQAAAFADRGSAHDYESDLARAIADYDAAIAICEAIRDRLLAQGVEAAWSLPLRNDLAGTLQNRGAAHYANGDLARAIADYDAAIAISEAIRDSLLEQGGEAAWSLPLRNNLAGVLQNRGAAYNDNGEPARAIADYDAAIAISEAIRDSLLAHGGEAAWSLPLRNDLAGILQNRGIAHRANGDPDRAIADYDAAIAICEAIRDRLLAQGGEAVWSLPLRNHLARVLSNRGVAYDENGDPARAIADYDAAIAIAEAIRDRLLAQGGEAAWSIPLRNDLATFLENRGNALRANGELARAIADGDAATAIREAIRDRLLAEGSEAAWSLPLRNDLARVLQNCGLAHSDNRDPARAIADYDAAIAIAEAIRDRLLAQGGEAAWSLPLRNDLARVLSNRGNAHRTNGDSARAIADYDAAIAIREAIRKRLLAQGGEAAWSPPLRVDLACSLGARAAALGPQHGQADLTALRAIGAALRSSGQPAVIDQVQRFIYVVEQAWAGRDATSPLDKLSRATGLGRRNPLFWLLLSVLFVIRLALRPLVWLWRLIGRR